MTFFLPHVPEVNYCEPRRNRSNLKEATGSQKVTKSQFSGFIVFLNWRQELISALYEYQRGSNDNAKLFRPYPDARRFRDERTRNETNGFLTFCSGNVWTRAEIKLRPCTLTRYTNNMLVNTRLRQISQKCLTVGGVCSVTCVNSEQLQCEVVKVMAPCGGC